MCSRVRLFREKAGWPQAAFAYELSVSRNKLASIEYSRTPLRYDLAKAFCERFNVSQAWLAEGVGEPSPRIHFDVSIERQIPNRILFTQAYERMLKPRLSQFRLTVLKTLPGTGIKVEFPEPVGISENRRYEWRLWESLRSVFRRVPAEKRLRFCQLVASGIAEAERDLTESSLKSISVDVQPNQLSKLLKRLNSLTAERGKKAELAKLLGVPAARVSEWLSGDKEPGGESTLRLLAWVQAEEDKQTKSPGRVSSTTRAETRKRKSSYEKPKSSPP